MAPRQRVLERVKEVPEHPGQDGVVENAYQEGNHHGGNSYSQGEKKVKQHFVYQRKVLNSNIFTDDSRPPTDSTQ